jgi:N-acetylmuramoyl-L-alanine amidase
MYADALARERVLRAAMTDASPTPPSAIAIRELVAAYEKIARQYRTSGYSDNALWQAAQLAADAFDRYGHAQDRRTSVRLLEALVARYPSSSLQPKAQARLADLKPPTAPDATATVLPAPVAPAPPAPVAEPATSPAQARAVLRQIRRVVLPDTVRVTVEFDAETRFREEKLSNPARVFMDFEASRAAPPLVDAVLSYDTDVVRQVRIGRHPNQTTRVVIDLEGVTKYSVFTLHNPYRVVVDCQRPPRSAGPPASVTRPGAAVSMDVAAPTSGTALRLLPRSPLPTPRSPVFAPALANPAPLTYPIAEAALVFASRLPRRHVLTASIPIPAATFDLAAAMASAPLASSGTSADASPSGAVEAGKPVLPAVVTVPTAPPAAPAPAMRSGLSMARQLGLGVGRIVIDAGHGGHDPGAMAPGINEADVTLDIALRLEKLLAKQPGVETVLTRRTDDFVPLEERTAIATREGADLFLSIHVNANPVSSVHGVETYLLNFASSAEAAAVASRENSASDRTMNSLPDIVKAIALNNKVDESRDLAMAVQASMIRRLRPLNKSIRDLGVRQAPFVVLIGASMPSILVEVAFITNRQEARLLKSANYKQRIAEALADALVRYQRSLKNVQTIAGRASGQ